MEEFTFSERKISWMKLVSNEAGGYKEIEAYYDKCMKGRRREGEGAETYWSYISRILVVG